MNFPVSIYRKLCSRRDKVSEYLGALCLLSMWGKSKQLVSTFGIILYAYYRLDINSHITCSFFCGVLDLLSSSNKLSNHCSKEKMKKEK